MEDQAVTSLYRKVVSPSVKFKTEELKKEPHNRHVQFRGQSSLAVRRLTANPSRSTYSAPGRVQSSDIIVKRSNSPYKLQEDGFEQARQYDFHPTTHFKTTSLPAMPMTSKYAQSTAKGTSRSVPLSVTRQSTTSLPDKWHVADINPRILYTTQKQRQFAESKAKSECRRLKRKSEIIAHRVDRHYYLCGSQIPVKNRWDVDANDLLRLKLLAHHKQLAQYQAMKDAQHDYIDPRESPSGQMISPTPSSAKENGVDLGVLLSGQQSPHGSEGKWAEDTKSETSSIDDLDIVAMRGARKMRQAKSNTPENTPDGTSTVDAGDKPLEASSTETEAGGNVGDKDEENKEISKTENEELNKNANLNTEKPEENNEKDKTTKPSSSKSTKKVKNLRFQDDVIKKPANQRRAKSGGKENQKEKSDENKEKQDDGHVNPYMDEWLGVKKKEVDGRYKPGKPPPNRIFISSEISKSKNTQVAKFSDMFLTETIALQERLTNADIDVTPESKYGIIGDKQKDTFKSMFNEIDKDKNGSVTLEELKLKMMPVVSRDDIKHFVQVFDLNKDQTVDSREFTAICCLNDRLAGTRTETADGSIALELEKLAQHIVIFKEMYKTMDEDDDNRLDVNEVLVMVSAAMGTEMGTDLNDARRVLSAARDEFGYIDFVGFMSYIPFFAKLLRAIMQNPLSINDIEKARERVKQKELTFKPKKITKKEPKSWEVY